MYIDIQKKKKKKKKKKSMNEVWLKSMTLVFGWYIGGKFSYIYPKSSFVWVSFI